MRRRISQFAAALILNPFLPNLLRGRIYQGPLKHVCVPALNCYSCPAAFGACPVGSLQVALVTVRGWLGGLAAAAAAAAALYVAGAILLVGAVGGRFACGWICPFGLLQELLFVRRAVRGAHLPAGARSLKYALLVVLVIGLPLALPYPSSPNFCKYVCPAGTIEAGVPLVAHDKVAGRGAFDIGRLFAWKVALAAGVFVGMLFISRFFCRVFCPLGAAWGLFNRVSLLAMEVDRSRCDLCGFCRAVCPVDISIYADPDSAECVRCFKCTHCPQGAVRVVLRGARRAVEKSGRARDGAAGEEKQTESGGCHE